MEGKLYESWGNLFQQYWVENTRVGNPSEFKKVICSKVTRFRGFSQQDSNEFISIFLNYLNEDLNYITKKPYIEINEKQKNESDEECSKRFWDINIKRNDELLQIFFADNLSQH